MHGCCSNECLDIIQLPIEEQKRLRKGQQKGNLIFKKGKSPALKFKKERNVFEEVIPQKTATVTEIRKKNRERKVLVGKGEHYFTKASVAQFSIQNQSVKTGDEVLIDRKSTRLNSSHVRISYAVFCLKKKITTRRCSCRKMESGNTARASKLRRWKRHRPSACQN